MVNEAPGEQITSASVTNELQRTKGTPYHCDRVMSYVPSGCTVPPGTAIEARRALIHALTAKRALAPKRATGRCPRPRAAGYLARSWSCALKRSAPAQLSDELVELHPDSLYLPLTEIPEATEMIERFAAAGTSVAAVLPRVIHDSELEAVGRLCSERAPSA